MFLTTQQDQFLRELAAGHSGPPIPEAKRAYFQERLRNRLFDFVLGKFVEQQQEKGLTKAALARRIGKTPPEISRSLGAPGNWTLDTLSDLLLGIAAEELEPASSSLLGRASRNFQNEDWIIQSQQDKTRSQPASPQLPAVSRLPQQVHSVPPELAGWPLK
jgi:hypothetical protein